MPVAATFVQGSMPDLLDPATLGNIVIAAMWQHSAHSGDLTATLGSQPMAELVGQDSAQVGFGGGGSFYLHWCKVDATGAGATTVTYDDNGAIGDAGVQLTEWSGADIVELVDLLEDDYAGTSGTMDETLDITDGFLNAEARLALYLFGASGNSARPAIAAPFPTTSTGTQTYNGGPGGGLLRWRSAREQRTDDFVSVSTVANGSDGDTTLFTGAVRFIVEFEVLAADEQDSSPLRRRRYFVTARELPYRITDRDLQGRAA